MEQEKVDNINKEAIEILGYEKAPANFTSLVMDRIQRETVLAPTKDNPVIGKWGWLLIVLVFVLLLAVFWYLSPPQNQQNNYLADSFLKDWWVKYLHPGLNAILTAGSHFGRVVLIGISATILLFADTLLGNRIKRRITYN
jgi:hypothetical protein